MRPSYTFSGENTMALTGLDCVPRENYEGPMLVTFHVGASKKIYSAYVHPWNALAYIAVTVAGMTILSRCVHSWNE